MSPALAAFLLKYRATLIGAAIALLLALAAHLYVGKVYDKGYTAGSDATTKQWQQKYAKDVGQANTRIAELEAMSGRTSAEAERKISEANAAIAKLQKEIAAKDQQYNRTVYGQQGNAVCSLPEDLYLGKVFSEAWNKLNAALR